MILKNLQAGETVYAILCILTIIALGHFSKQLPQIPDEWPSTGEGNYQDRMIPTLPKLKPRMFWAESVLNFTLVPLREKVLQVHFTTFLDLTRL